MDRLTVQISLDKDYSHVQQLCAGFVELHRRGVIQLSQRCDIAEAGHRWGGLYAEVNGARVFYDTFDGQEICEPILNDVDFYFKRSYSKLACQDEKKILPLGLNYRVFAKGIDTFRVRRVVSLARRRGSGWLRRVLGDLRSSPAISVAKFGAAPRIDIPPKVIFMARLWDPACAKGDSKTIESLNEMRVETVLRLKRELGSLFVGGIQPSKYAPARYRNAILLSERSFTQRRYLATLGGVSIGVATRGLWRSIGWKFGEYVSLAKAIVTEPLDYEIPGNLSAGRNYLEFQTPDECVEMVTRLVENRDLRTRLMFNNYDYYHKFLRPDQLILNSIVQVLNGDVSRWSSPLFDRTTG